MEVLIRVQRRVLTLYERADIWNEEELELSINQLHFYIRKMVEERRRPVQEPLPRSRRPSPLLREQPVLQHNIQILSSEEEEREEECMICLENHKISDILTTDCRHHFCRQGYLDWVNSRASRNKCPICRKEAPITTIYVSS